MDARKKMKSQQLTRRAMPLLSVESSVLSDSRSQTKARLVHTHSWLFVITQRL